MTFDLFPRSLNNADSYRKLDLLDAEVLHYAALFSHSEADELFQHLRREIAWRQETISIYGRTLAVPRLTAWYGDTGKSYSYSGIKSEPTPWIPVLQHIRERIERVSATTFNSVLLNLYRDGSDSVSWHADDEPELGHNPVIGSVSFGASRPFQMRHRTDRAQRHAVVLDSGSFLLMKGSTQRCWLHQIPKSRRLLGARINLTYRVVS